MRLSDREIHKEIEEGELVIVGTIPKYPFDKVKQVQPCSIDLRLDNKFFKFKKEVTEFDIKNLKNVNDYLYIFEVNEGEPITLRPHEILFGQIYEQLRLPCDCSGMIEGRSRFARLGLSVHATGGFINPEFEGAMPLQIINNNDIPITIYPYINICQLILVRLTSKPLIPYPKRSDNPYHKEKIASPSVSHKDPALGYNEGNLPNLNVEIEKRLIEKYLKEMELNKFKESVSKEIHPNITNIKYNIENSNIGLINTGQIEKAKKIESNIIELKNKGNAKVAEGIKQITETLLNSKELKDEIKNEIFEQLEELSKQANLPKDKRVNKSVLKAIISSIGGALSAGGGLAEIWSTWGTEISSFFGI